MRWFSFLFRKQASDRQLDKELRFHLEQQIDEYIALGITPEEARRKARLDFGGLEQIKEDCRDTRCPRWFRDLVQDLRYGARLLRKKPGFTTLVVATLALGIGANTAIFSVINSVLLLPLPYSDPERLVQIREIDPKGASHDASPADFVNWRNLSRSFEGMTAIWGMSINLTGGEYPEQVLAMTVTSDFYRVFRAQPARGRAFLEQEYNVPFWPRPDRPNAHTIILSHGLWQRRFGGDPGLIGKALTIDGRQVTVVGIMPADFRFNEVPGLGTAECWIPGEWDENEYPAVRQFIVVGRLRVGVARSQAQSEMNVIAGVLGKKRPKENAGWGASLVPLQEIIVGPVRNELLVLFGAVAFVLLIACANIANLLLTRAVARQREVAVRAALGAGRLRLMRQLLTETFVLSISAGALGLMLARMGIAGLIALAPADLPRLAEISLDSRAFMFTLLISLAAGLACGAAPALRVSKAELANALKEGLTTSMGKRRRWLHDALAVAQIALALMLLVGSGLMVRTFIRLQSVELGFNPQNVLTASVPAFRRGRSSAEAVAVYQRLMDRVRTIPGVLHAGVGVIPLRGGGSNLFFPDGQGEGIRCETDAPSPDYFRALSARLSAGRLFTEQDGRDAQAVAIVNRTAAQVMWPGQSAIGKRLAYDTDRWKVTIVGVIEDIRMSNLEGSPKPRVYVPLTQSKATFPGTMVVQTKGDPLELVGALRQALKAVDGETPLGRVATMEELLSRLLAPRRFIAALISSFSILAFVLATVGIYGLLSYTTSTRTHEFGIRIAFGARAVDVLQLVFRQGLALVILGELLGLVGALALNQVMTTLVWGVTTTDPVTYLAAIGAWALLALFACYIPARRATRADPLVALRCE